MAAAEMEAASLKGLVAEVLGCICPLQSMTEPPLENIRREYLESRYRKQKGKG